MKDVYLFRLRGAVNSGSLQSCLDLSNEIHRAEERGYDLSSREDFYWQQLTDKVMRLRALGRAVSVDSIRRK
jgi:hypothetical protein